MQLLKGDKLLTKVQCDVLRGLAIMGIFLHNFCHWLRGGFHENEYWYYQENSDAAWNYWTAGGLDVFAPIQFFSFLGHYGVPLFLFLSGFGLVMKYERSGASRVGVFTFVGYQWLKLFRLMLLGFVLSALTYIACGNAPHPWNETLAQLGMVSNFLFVKPGSAIVPGPYWFFGLMLEVYVIYRLLVYSTSRHKRWRWLMPVLIAVVAWFVMMLCKGHSLRLEYLRYNAAVAMLPFALGVLAGRYGLPALPRWLLGVVAVVSLPLLLAVNLNFHAWLWAPVLVIAGAVAFVKCFEGMSAWCTSWFMRPLSWLGGLSSMVFVVHSIPRMPIFKYKLWSQTCLNVSDYGWIALYIVLTLVLAWLYKQYLRLIPNPRLRGNSVSFRA